jgi:hypothetical protein
MAEEVYSFHGDREVRESRKEEARVPMFPLRAHPQ